MAKRVFTGLKALGRSALREHLLGVAAHARQTHGDLSAPAALAHLLGDRGVVRYPCTLAFDDGPVRPGTFATLTWHEGAGLKTATLVLSARLRGHPGLALVVAYHLPSVNYGRMPTADDALAFGACLLGLSEDEYYARLCALMDEDPA